jgi:putative two-component system response regulator
MDAIMEKQNILIVDDEDLIRRSLNRKLSKVGYSCDEASSAEDALRHLKTRQADLVILDVKMPGKTGIEILPEIKQNYPDTAVVMVTAVNDPQTIVTSMKNGAHDYITKPFELNEVVESVDNALIKRKVEIEVKKHNQSLTHIIDDQGKEIRRLTLGSFEALVNALEAKDKYTAGHSRRVAQISKIIGQALGMTSEYLETLRWGALLHDVGKISIDPAIQNKPSKLTDEEYERMMMHTQIGPDIVGPVANQIIIDIIRYHHYRYDGRGKDQLIHGENIPIGARIVAVADSYDAMTSDRPYRKALTNEAAIAEVRRCCGSQFDPKIASLMVETWTQTGQEYISLQDSFL